MSPELKIAIIGLIVMGITAIGVFVGPQLAAWCSRRKQEQDKKLRAHFEELKSKVGDPRMNVASHVSKERGKLGTSNAVADLVSFRPFPRCSSFEEGEQSVSFKEHLPELAAKWEELREKIGEHNENCDQFRREIVQACTRFPFISDIDFAPLFTRWREIAANRRPWPDFQQIEIYRCQDGYAVYASGWSASPVAWGTTDDKEKYKLAFKEVGEKQECQAKAAKIEESASKLIEELRKFADEVGATFKDMGTYWPSKKFRKLKSCPICQKF